MAFEGIGQAYANWGAAREEQRTANDPFYQFTQLAAQAAQEWAAEQEKDKEMAKKKAETYNSSATNQFIKATDGYNEQTKNLAFNSLATFEGRLNEASLIKNVTERNQAMNAIMGEIQTFTGQLRRGQDIIKNHAENIDGGTYSVGSGLTKANKFINGEYETYIGTDPTADGFNEFHFKLKDDNGAIVVDKGFDFFEQNNVVRNDKIGGQVKSKIDQAVRTAFETNDFQYNNAFFKPLVTAVAADKKTAYSLYHDKLMDNQTTSFAEDWKASHPDGNADWMMIHNTELPTNKDAVNGIIANSGYNQNAIEGQVTVGLESYIQKEFERRVKLKQAKIKADKQTAIKESKEQASVQVDAGSYINRDYANAAAERMKKGEEFTWEGQTYKAVPGGYVVNPGTENEIPFNVSEDGLKPLIDFMDRKAVQVPAPTEEDPNAFSIESMQRGYLMYNPIFTNLYK